MVNSVLQNNVGVEGKSVYVMSVHDTKSHKYRREWFLTESRIFAILGK